MSMVKTLLSLEKALLARGQTIKTLYGMIGRVITKSAESAASELRRVQDGWMRIVMTYYEGNRKGKDPGPTHEQMESEINRIIAGESAHKVCAALGLNERFTSVAAATRAIHHKIEGRVGAFRRTYA